MRAAIYAALQPKEVDVLWISREGGAMQLHMFWALFIHAQDAQDIRDDWDKQAEVWEDLKKVRNYLDSLPPRTN